MIFFLCKVLEFLAREIRKEKEIKWIPKKNE
jgi:hypothetical protein